MDEKFGALARIAKWLARLFGSRLETPRRADDFVQMTADTFQPEGRRDDR